MDMGQMLTQAAASNPYKTAVIFRDSRTSYSELNRRANQVANGLIWLGVRPGERVGLLMHNLPLFMEAYYGILKAGASVVPLNVLYKAGEVEYILNDSGAKAVLSFGPFAQVALAAAANCPDLRSVVVAAPQDVPGGVSWREVVAEASEAPPNVAVNPENVAVICYTSGTTGRPKGAMLSHRNLLGNCQQCMALPQIATRPDDVVWIALPLFHIYAMNVGMNLAVFNGATMLLIQRFDPPPSAEPPQKSPAPVMQAAPPMFLAWPQIPPFTNYPPTPLPLVPPTPPPPPPLGLN